MAITLMRLEKRTIELHNNIYDTYKEIDKDIDAIKINCENINNNIDKLENSINIIYNYIKGVDTTVNATLTIIKEINNRVANNHTETNYRIDANNTRMAELSDKLTNLSTQLNKCNTKLITAKNSNRPRKVAKPVAHPKHND